VRQIEVRNVDGKPRLRINLRFGGDVQTLPADLRFSPVSGSETSEHSQQNEGAREFVIEVAA
jgi:hypothetical protein